MKKDVVREAPAKKTSSSTPKDIPFVIAPHESAPILSEALDAGKIIDQLYDVAMSGKISTANEEIRQLLREAGIVNLWFFLRVIAGYTGPYNQITPHLHMDMCNFRQSSYCMDDGARGAFLIPRNHYKSTVATHGASAWEIIRFPNIRIRIVNAILDNARKFMRNIARTFDSNEFLAWLYPEFVPQGRSPRWNEDELVIPARTRYFPEPTVQIGGATGASESAHHNLIVIDDIAGLDDLTSERGGNAQMTAKINWFKTNRDTLLEDQNTSRIVFVGTRYSLDDPGELIVNNLRKVVGFQDPDLDTKPDGEWTLYYRQAIEHGKVIFPEKHNLRALQRIAEDDWWTYITQYMNKPQATGLVEFRDIGVRKCSIAYLTERGQWVIIKKLDQNFDEDVDPIVSLAECDVIMAVDPAGTDTGINAKTSKTAIELWARDWQGNNYLLWMKAGYYSPMQMFDYIFEGQRKFEGHVRGVAVESNAMQRILLPLLRKEGRERFQYINPIPVPSAGDKDARIRNNLGRELQRGTIWLCEGYGTDFIEEKNLFPQSKWKKDVLDAAEKAMVTLRRPEEPGASERFEEEDLYEYESENVTGY
jgi:hypothetical protein